MAQTGRGVGRLACFVFFAGGRGAIRHAVWLLTTWTLKRARTTAGRAAFFVAALTVFATMVSIGWTRDPLRLWRGF
jgi:NhaP-type Na+/H+ or K+/H+ antiporter